MTMSVLERNRRAVDPCRTASVLLEARTAIGWSQYELARRSGMTRDLVAKMERGASVRLETLFLASTALGVDIIDLFKRAREMP